MNEREKWFYVILLSISAFSTIINSKWNILN